jgi:hypothetical protein
MRGSMKMLREEAPNVSYEGHNCRKRKVGLVDFSLGDYIDIYDHCHSLCGELFSFT